MLYIGILIGWIILVGLILKFNYNASKHEKKGVAMRWIVNYLRQCFCKHDFEKDIVYHYYSDDYTMPDKVTVHMTCNKCGYHTKYER
jgi:hypothetical protein